MKRLLSIIFISLLAINLLAQKNSRRLTTIYSGCGYMSSVLQYQDGSDVFMLRFNDTLFSAGYDLEKGTAQDVYDVLKLFNDFVAKHKEDYGYIEDNAGYTLMIVEKRYSMVPTMLRVTKQGQSHEVDIKCIKKGMKEFEKYCKRNSIELK